MKQAMVDTCVLLDVATEDRRWFGWSSTALAAAADAGPLVINAVIYGELSVGFTAIEKLEQVLDPMIFDYRPIPKEAAFLAGKVFAHYRQRGGPRRQLLPDLLIGAHASVEALALLTRDVERFARYFPQLRLIRPPAAAGE